MNKNSSYCRPFLNRCLRKKKSCPAHCKKICVKYVQPARPESCKPIAQYVTPELALENKTVYNTSYLGVDAMVANNCRPTPYISKGHIELLAAPLESSTTMKMSYQGYCSPPPEPYRPQGALALSTSPMKQMTTQRHDFIEKPFVHSHLFVPPVNLSLIKAKMEDKTITSESFMKPGQQPKSMSFKPLRVYEPPNVPMDRVTITSNSYQKQKLCPKEDLPWVPQRCYQHPTLPMEKETIYNKSYEPPGHEIEVECGDPDAVLTCTCHIRTATEDLE